MNFFVADENDARVLRAMIDRERQRRQNIPGGRKEESYSAAPECYIAKVPSEGIPGVTPSTGTGSGTGTMDDDEISSTECEIYGITGNTTKRLTPMGFSEEVFNISPYRISTGYVKIQRDMYGDWIVGRHRPDIYGIAAENITYGGSGTVYVYENGDFTNDLRTEEVLFNHIGQSGDVIEAWTLVEARWWDDLNDGEGGYRISNANCDPETGTGTGT